MNKILVIFYILIYCFEIASSFCPDIPKCTCIEIKPKGKNAQIGEGYKLKCTRVQKLQDVALEDVANASAIKHIDLSRNNISVIRTNAFPPMDVNKIDLDRNAISHIEERAFSHLSFLKILILSNNRLQILEPEVFDGLYALEILKINQNLLTSFSEKVLNEAKSLSKLNITGNPLSCDCDIWWLRTGLVQLLSNPTCYDPPSLSGTIVDRLSEADALCDWSAQIDHELRLIPNKNQIIFEGDTITFVCKVTNIGFDKENETFVVWSVNGSDYHALMRDFNDTVKITNKTIRKSSIVESTLKITGINENHSGIYSCHFASTRDNQSVSARLVVLTRRTKYCEVTVTETNKGYYAWPKTISGNRVELPCQIGENGSGDGDGDGDENIARNYLRASYECSANGTWSDFNAQKCPYVSSVTRILHQFSKMNLTDSMNHIPSLIVSADRLRNFTSYHLREMTDFNDISYVVETVQNYLPFLSKSKELGKILVDILSYLSDAPEEALTEAQKQRNIGAQILTIIESISKFDSPASFESKNLAWKEFPIGPDFGGVICSWTIEDDDVPIVMNCTIPMENNVPIKNTEEFLDLPPNILSYSAELEIAPYYLAVAVLRNDKFFHDKISNGKWRAASAVVAANIIGRRGTKLDRDAPAIVTLKNSRSGSDSHLLWWDAESCSWSTEACQVSPPGKAATTTTMKIAPSNRDILIFQCHRMGYFLLATETTPQSGVTSDVQWSKTESYHLIYASIYLGTFVGAACLVSTAFAYVIYFPSIQMSSKMKHSLINTWISAALFMLIFGMGVHRIEYELSCQIIGLLIHYFCLCTLFWLAITTRVLYERVQKCHTAASVGTPSEDASAPVETTVVRKPIGGVYLVGYGISASVCLISGAVNLNGYANDRLCFLSSGPAMGFVLIPVSMVLLYLTAMCLLVKCATDDLNSNTQLSVGTQAIDLELLDASGVGVAVSGGGVGEGGSVRSLNTPSSQVEDAQHSPKTQLRTLAAFAAGYVALLACTGGYVLRLGKWPREGEVFAVAYAGISTAMGAFTALIHCCARHDVRSAWSNRKKNVSYGGNWRPGTAADPLVSNNRMGSAAAGSAAITNENGFVAAREEDFRGRRVLDLTRLRPRPPPSDADFFYNPQQSIVAKKFFKKQRRKRNNNLHFMVRRCRSGGSSPISARLFEPFRTTATLDSERTRFISGGGEEDITVATTGTTKRGGAFHIPSIREYAPEYAEISEKYCDPFDGARGLEAISDVNSEPTYNYAFVAGGRPVATAAVARHHFSASDSSASHLYATVAPEVSSIDRWARRGVSYRPPAGGRNANSTAGIVRKKTGASVPPCGRISNRKTTRENASDGKIETRV